MFKQMYFIAPNAIKQFQEEVANINSGQVIKIIQETLQNLNKPCQWGQREGRLMPFYQCDYRGVIFYVPIIKGYGKWPTVPTIYGPEKFRKEINFHEKTHNSQIRSENN